MKNLILCIFILLGVVSSAYAQKGHAGKWKKIEGLSDKETIKKLQERIIILDKRDEQMRRHVTDLSERIYDIECVYLKLPGAC